MVYLQQPSPPTCDDCEAWFYDTNTWTRKKHQGKDHPRPKGSPTPCHCCPKCAGAEAPKDRNPTTGRKAEWTDANWQTWDYYWECKAMSGRVPTDEVTRRHFGLIEHVLKMQEMGLARRIAEKPSIVFAK